VKFLAPLLGIVIYLALQATVADRIAIGSVAPDFVVVCGLLGSARSSGAVRFLRRLCRRLGNPDTSTQRPTRAARFCSQRTAATSPGVLVLAIVFFVAASPDIVYLLIYRGWGRRRS
jgi:hypothetical protein